MSVFYLGGLAALYLAGFYTLGANIDLFGATFDHRCNFLNIWSKHTIGHAM